MVDYWNMTYDGGQGWVPVGIGEQGNAVWFDPVESVEQVTVFCKTCGHAVTVRKDDDPIPYGDPRLCEHF